MDDINSKKGSSNMNNNSSLENDLMMKIKRFNDENQSLKYKLEILKEDFNYLVLPAMTGNYYLRSGKSYQITMNQPYTKIQG